MFTSDAVPLAVKVSVKYPVTPSVTLGNVCHSIPYNAKLNLFGSLSNHASLKSLYMKSFSSNFFKYVGSNFVICSSGVLLLSIRKLALKLLSSINNAPSSANVFVVWNVLVGSDISIYLLCPACVLFVTLSFAMFVLFAKGNTW